MGLHLAFGTHVPNTCSQKEGAMRIQVQVKGRFGGRWVDEKVFLNAFFFFFNAVPTRINKTFPFNVNW